MNPVYKGAALLVLLAAPAFGHESPKGMKYDQFCCNKQDCEPISPSRVTIIPEGYRIDIRPGDHSLATRNHSFIVKQGEERRSTDGDYHLCVFPREDLLRCFYAPPLGF